jgi:hypothetical protein
LVQKKCDINLAFLCREIGAELHMPASIIKPILERVFLKILKHMMYGRTIHIPKFGRFGSKYIPPKNAYSSYVGGYYQTKAKIIPKLSFNKIAVDYVMNTQEDKAQEKAKEKKK